MHKKTSKLNVKKPQSIILHSNYTTNKQPNQALFPVFLYYFYFFTLIFSSAILCIEQTIKLPPSHFTPRFKTFFRRKNGVFFVFSKEKFFSFFSQNGTKIGLFLHVFSAFFPQKSTKRHTDVTIKNEKNPHFYTPRFPSKICFSPLSRFLTAPSFIICKPTL